MQKDEIKLKYNGWNEYTRRKKIRLDFHFHSWVLHLWQIRRASERASIVEGERACLKLCAREIYKTNGRKTGCDLVYLFFLFFLFLCGFLVLDRKDFYLNFNLCELHLCSRNFRRWSRELIIVILNLNFMRET